MKALISGQAGIAVLIDGNEYTSIEVHLRSLSVGLNMTCLISW